MLSSLTGSQDSPEKLEDVAVEKDNLGMANNNMSLFL